MRPIALENDVEHALFEPILFGRRNRTGDIRAQTADRRGPMHRHRQGLQVGAEQYFRGKRREAAQRQPDARLIDRRKRNDNLVDRPRLHGGLQPLDHLKVREMARRIQVTQTHVADGRVGRVLPDLDLHGVDVFAGAQNRKMARELPGPDQGLHPAHEGPTHQDQSDRAQREPT